MSGHSPRRVRGLAGLTAAATLLVSPNGFAGPSPLPSENEAASEHAPEQPETSAPTPEAPTPETTSTEPTPAAPAADAPAPAEPAPTEPPPAQPVPPPELDADTDTDEEPTDDSDDDEPFEDDYDVLRDSPEGRTAQRWFAAGIAATVTGAVLVGGAIAYGLTDPCNLNAGNNCFSEARDRAAVTMGSPGGVLLLGGVAMTVIGALQRRSLRRSVAVVPTGTGVLLVGRF